MTVITCMFAHLFDMFLDLNNLPHDEYISIPLCFIMVIVSVALDASFIYRNFRK